MVVEKRVSLITPTASSALLREAGIDTAKDIGTERKISDEAHPRKDRAALLTSSRHHALQLLQNTTDNGDAGIHLHVLSGL